jgi:hypothetical protein
MIKFCNRIRKSIFKLHIDQLKRLTLCFSSIEDSETRESVIYFFETLLNAKKDNNLKYIIHFSKYISKINSITLKEKLIEMAKMTAL